MRGDAPMAPQGLRRRGTIGVGSPGAGRSRPRGQRHPSRASPGRWPARVPSSRSSACWWRPRGHPPVRPGHRLALRRGSVGVVGQARRQNALRVPRRTAATASALMIGLALVAGISVLAHSVKASVTEGVGQRADLQLRAQRRQHSRARRPWRRQARALPEVAVRRRHQPRRRPASGPSAPSAAAATASDVADNFVVTCRAGRLDALGGDAVLVDETTATARGWQRR